MAVSISTLEINSRIDISLLKVMVLFAVGCPFGFSASLCVGTILLEL